MNNGVWVVGWYFRCRVVGKRKGSSRATLVRVKAKRASEELLHSISSLGSSVVPLPRSLRSSLARPLLGQGEVNARTGDKQNSISPELSILLRPVLPRGLCRRVLLPGLCLEGFLLCPVSPTS